MLEVLSSGHRKSFECLWPRFSQDRRHPLLRLPLISGSSNSLFSDSQTFLWVDRSTGFVSHMHPPAHLTLDTADT